MKNPLVCVQRGKKQRQLPVQLRPGCKEIGLREVGGGGKAGPPT